MAAMLQAALAAVLAFSPAPAASCGATTGIEPLLERGRVLLLGELHGTAEAPAFVANVACHARSQGLDVTIALELPHAEQEQVRDPDSEIVDLPFWAKDYQDGRTSVAMLRLIEWAHARTAADGVELILIDEPSNFRRRDERMAVHILDAFGPGARALLRRPHREHPQPHRTRVRPHGRARRGGSRCRAGHLAQHGPRRWQRLDLRGDGRVWRPRLRPARGRPGPGR